MQARTSRIMVHAQLCLEGEDRWTDYCNTSRKRCIDARFKQICAFMLDLGDEVFTLDDLKHAFFRENDVVGRTEALTYEEWTCFKPYLVQLAKDARQKRLNT
ncbi:hypothetical protein PENSPDRAFT_477384 [Peniophora sp. CONT]|nr:hypothetical protein PENSPDRAFT_477384 [Peniophora sp. CONT]